MLTAQETERLNQRRSMGILWLVAWLVAGLLYWLDPLGVRVVMLWIGPIPGLVAMRYFAWIGGYKAARLADRRSVFEQVDHA
jgi:hypothetical protein